MRRGNFFWFFRKKDLREPRGIVYTIYSAHQAHERRKIVATPISHQPVPPAWFLERPKTADLPL